MSKRRRRVPKVTDSVRWQSYVFKTMDPPKPKAAEARNAALLRDRFPGAKPL